MYIIYIFIKYIATRFNFGVGLSSKCKEINKCNNVFGRNVSTNTPCLDWRNILRQIVRTNI